MADTYWRKKNGQVAVAHTPAQEVKLGFDGATKLTVKAGKAAFDKQNGEPTAADVSKSDEVSTAPDEAPKGGQK